MRSSCRPWMVVWADALTLSLENSLLLLVAWELVKKKRAVVLCGLNSRQANTRFWQRLELIGLGPSCIQRWIQRRCDLNIWLRLGKRKRRELYRWRTVTTRTSSVAFHGASKEENQWSASYFVCVCVVCSPLFFLCLFVRSVNPTRSFTAL